MPNSTLTFVEGKDAALEETIARFQSKLNDLGFTIEVVSWLNPVPNVWSVYIRDRDCPQCFTNGKGTTKPSAFASALGEFLERLSCNYFFADFYLGDKIANSEFVHYPNEQWFPLTDDDSVPAGLLDDDLLAFYQDETELSASELVDLQSGNDERGICALPFVRQDTQELVYIPINILDNLYASNGMSAGNNANETRVQALAEILERYVKNRILTETIRLPQIPAEVLARYPLVTKAIATLEEQGFPILAFDASLGGEYPVISVVLFNPANGSCFASFGAHPSFAVALERTVTELLQGRLLNQLDVFSPPTFDNEEVGDYTNLETHFTDSSGLVSWDLFSQQTDYEFVDWDFGGTTEEDFATLLEMFHQQDAPVYIADYQHLGVDACRIIVPGMSEIYPVDDLQMANNTMGVHWRDLIFSLPNSDATSEEYLSLIDQLDEEGLDNMQPIAELLGIVPGDDTVWANLRVGELKGMLALAGGNLVLGLAWVEWVQSFNASTFGAKQQNYYRCLYTILCFEIDEFERDFADYHAAFARMYGAQTVDAVRAVIAGKKRFYGMKAIGAELSELPAHQQLLAAYEKLQVAKSNDDCLECET